MKSHELDSFFDTSAFSYGVFNKAVSSSDCIASMVSW
jgi:hypothetical protein